MAMWCLASLRAHLPYPGRIVSEVPLTRNPATRTRAQVARVRAEYPNQLDYSGFRDQARKGYDSRKKNKKINYPLGEHSSKKMVHILGSVELGKATLEWGPWASASRVG